MIYSCYLINIVGSSGGAKATVGKLNVKKLGYRYVELDQTQWKPSWTESTEEELFANLEKSLKRAPWVLDGGCSKTEPIKWNRVQLVFWLDLLFWSILYQVIIRTIRRLVMGKTLWAGKRESLKKDFLIVTRCLSGA